MRKLFIDTANLQDIQDGLIRGVISGVTTNPSLLAKEPKTDFIVHINKIADILTDHGSPPLSVEVFAKHPEDMYRQAHELLRDVHYDNVNIKIPIGYDELVTVTNLARDGVRVNVTCCFTTSQLLLAAQAGAKYVSLFYNRLIDAGGDPAEVLRTTNFCIRMNDLECEIIAGSIRKPTDIVDAWSSGADIVTAGLDVIKKGTEHVMTDKSVDGFLKDFDAWIQ